MRRESLVAFFRDYIASDRLRNAVFVVHDNGFRARRWTYGDIASASRAFAARLGEAGIAPGDRVVIWSENRGEWIAALWGTLLARAVAVPVDYRTSADQAHRIRNIVQARVMVVGTDVSPREGDGYTLWRLDDPNLWNPNLCNQNPWNQNPEPGTEPREPSEPEEPVEPPLAEILFTSGATADPKGVTLTHRNLLANIHPIEQEIGHYRRYLRLVSPLRFLNLLPLSHMFGQSMATFVPPLLGGVTVFTRSLNPAEIVRQIKTRRVSVLVCVPRVLELLRDHVQRNSSRLTFPGSVGGNREKSTGKNFVRRWWRYRHVRREFGWKFWAIVVGGAPLDPELERFWRELGYLVIQGYGLTETAPIVTLTHPLKKGGAGTVGTAISGVEVRIADDGEVLVRGDNVTPGYYAAEGETQAALRDGWFHTGDIGSIDSEGRLTIRGRKKEMIVTAEGLNVFPDDIEQALNAQRGIRESAVVGIGAGDAGGERVHAVIVAAGDADVRDAVRRANAALEPHQRIWSWSLWPDGALPRTQGTGKLRRGEVRRRVGPAPAAKPAGPAVTVAELVSAAAGGRPVTSETAFDDLGLASLDRVQLVARIEEAFEISLDESDVATATTVGALENLVARTNQNVPHPSAEPAAPTEPVEPTERVPVKRRTSGIPFPTWNQSLAARAARRVLLPTLGFAANRVFTTVTVEGLEHLEGLDHPLIFAPNHQSHMDTPAVLQALPPRLRYRVAPAMAKEWFKAHFFPADFPLHAHLTNTFNYVAASLIYNAFPIPQYEAGARQTIRYIGRLFEMGRSLLIYPEGKRTDYGEIAPFRPGVGLIASRLHVPVVPVRIEGLDHVLSIRDNWPKRGPVRVTFGAPMRLEGGNYAQLAAQVRDAVIALQPYEEPTAPPPDAST